MITNKTSRYFIVSGHRFTPDLNKPYACLGWHKLFVVQTEDDGLIHIRDIMDNDVIEPVHCIDEIYDLCHINKHELIELPNHQFNHLYMLCKMLELMDNNTELAIGNEAVYFDNFKNDDTFFGCLTRRLGTDALIDGMWSDTVALRKKAVIAYHREACATIALYTYPERNLRKLANTI